MIQILEKHVADKIAAGEVIDRPLSVVKELVENAIDAKADVITVELKKGGKTYIRVTDNGCGIPADQVEIAFLRHATGKITKASDLESIQTLGFRGEALASICAVSRTELITKTSSEKSGTKLVIEGSDIVEHIPTGCPDGTTIIVRDLFYNTPARLKFMKSDAAESSLIIEFVSQIALAYANIKIRLINNETMLFSTAGKADRYQNILTVYSKEQANGLIRIEKEADYLQLEAYVSGLGVSKTNRTSQIFFVNGRVINSKVIERAVSEAYKEKLPDGRFPIVYLFLQSAPEKLDVNIHPNKREVRFSDVSLVMDFVSRSIGEGLQSKEAIPPIRETEQSKKDIAETYPMKKEKENPQQDIKALLSTLRTEQEKTGATFVKEATKTYDPPSFDFDELTLHGSVFQTYILATDVSCLYLIDQHAAHERIFFDRLMKQFKSKAPSAQPIMTPFTLQVSYAIKETQNDWLLALEQMGFSLELFGPKTYIVKEIPFFIGLQEAENFLHDYVDQISDDIQLDNLPLIEKIIGNSCKNAVKANDLLSKEEIKQLIDDLKHCEHPFSCPHGRPTFIKLTKHQLEKMFQRT